MLSYPRSLPVEYLQINSQNIDQIPSVKRLASNIYPIFRGIIKNSNICVNSITDYTLDFPFQAIVLVDKL